MIHSGVKAWLYTWLSIFNKPTGMLERACQLFTIFAFAALIIFPMLTISSVNEVSGNIPPIAPMIASSGEFIYVKNPHSHANHFFIDYQESGGKVYRMTEWTIPASLIGVAQKSPPLKVNVQGFLLKNGSGVFFPLHISTLDGNEVMSQQYALSQLDHHRSASRRLFFTLNTSCIIFIMGCFFSTYFAVKNKLDS